MNPFIMWSYREFKLLMGFTDHPHRGFETVTYIVGGENLHEDSLGNSGTLKTGDI